MNVILSTRPGEFGELAVGAIREFARDVVGDANIATFAGSSAPIDWSPLADAGWDELGIVEDGEGATLRDLAAAGTAWGRYCLPAPFVCTVLAKRHSAAARAVEGAVTFAIPVATAAPGYGYVPFGQVPGIQVATGLGAGDDTVIGLEASEPDDLGLTLLASEAPLVTSFSQTAAREIAVVSAAEAAGAAARLVDEGVAYVRQREQFGKPVGSFQAVKHHLANALIAAQSAETATVWAALQPDQYAIRRSRFAVDQSIRAAELVIQVHGGMGFTWEMGLHFYLRHIMAVREIVAGLEAEGALR